MPPAFHTWFSLPLAAPLACRCSVRNDRSGCWKRTWGVKETKSGMLDCFTITGHSNSHPVPPIGLGLFIWVSLWFPLRRKKVWVSLNQQVPLCSLSALPPPHCGHVKGVHSALLLKEVIKGHWLHLEWQASSVSFRGVKIPYPQ